MSQPNAEPKATEGVDPSPHSISLIDIADGIANGSWAVLLVVVVLYIKFKEPVSKYFERHITLLDTMKDTLQRNATAIEGLKQTDEDTARELKRLSDRLPSLEEKTEQILDVIYNMTDPDGYEPNDRLIKFPVRRRHRG